MNSLYPPFPASTRYAGRVIRWNPDDRELILERQEGSIRVDSVMASGVEIREGDLVAVLDGGEVCLLARAVDEGWRRRAHIDGLRAWSAFKVRIRDFFLERDFVEIDTPSLVVNPGSEPTLDVFGVDFRWGRGSRRLYLPTSPELHLKKALTRGLDRIFEMRPCFRNGEITAHHQPEFWMLEWYRAYTRLDAIADDVQELVRLFEPDVVVRRTTMRELFLRHAGIELSPADDEVIYREWVRSAGFDAPASWGVDDLFFWMFQEKIEPHLPPEELVLVNDWPPFQSALARIGPSGWAERFEVYWRGLELANAFHELNDPEEQARRLIADRGKKERTGAIDIPPDDQEFLAALRAGMPPSAGIALGVERLFMALHRVASISDLRLFPMSADNHSSGAGF